MREKESRSRVEFRRIAKCSVRISFSSSRGASSWNIYFFSSRKNLFFFESFGKVCPAGTTGGEGGDSGFKSDIFSSIDHRAGLPFVRGCFISALRQWRRERKRENEEGKRMRPLSVREQRTSFLYMLVSRLFTRGVNSRFFTTWPRARGFWDLAFSSPSRALPHFSTIFLQLDEMKSTGVERARKSPRGGSEISFCGRNTPGGKRGCQGKEVEQ